MLSAAMRAVPVQVGRAEASGLGRLGARGVRAVHPRGALRECHLHGAHRAAADTSGAVQQGTTQLHY